MHTSQFKNTEQIHAAFVEELRANATKAIENALGEAVSSFLPFVTADTDQNAFFQAREIVRGFLAGADNALLWGHSAKEVREAIAKAHPEALNEARIFDLEKEVADLKAEIKRIYEARY